MTEYLLSCDAFLAAMKLREEGSKLWAEAAERAYNSRGLAIQYTAKCTENHSLFCECEGCKTLPERPEWMRTLEDVVKMAARLVEILPDDYNVWTMQANELVDSQTPCRSARERRRTRRSPWWKSW